MHWIDQVLSSFANAISTSDSTGWAPFDPYTFWPHYAKPWMNRLWTAYEKAQEKKLNPGDLTRCFLGPQFLRQELVNTMFFSKSCNYDAEKTTKLLAWLKDILVSKCSADPFGFESTKILKKEDLNYLMKMFPFHQTNIEEAREAGKLIHACEELSWSLYTDWNYWQCFEIYGPYELQGNEKLLLRAFTNFAPGEIWPQMAGYEPSTIYVYTIYKDTDVKLDYWSHVLTRENLPQKMTQLLILEHGRLVKNLDELTTLRKNMEIAAVTQGKTFRGLTFEEAKQKEIECHCYTYKDLFTLLELDWRPTSEMLAAVKDKPLIEYKTPEFQSVQEKKEFWKKLHDPRENYFLEELKQ